MNESKVGCQILNYNDSENVIRQIDRIKKFNIFEFIVVVDNDSTDKSYDLLQKMYKNDEKVYILRTKMNGGYGFGQNFGLKYIYKNLKVKYILIVNPDVQFDASCLKKQLRVAEEKNAAIVSSTQIINHKRVNVPAWKIPNIREWIFSETRLRKRFNTFHYTNDHFMPKVSKVECVRGAMFLVDVLKFMSVGGYDTNMFLYGEETLIGFKMKERGYSTYILNDEYYDHRVASSINKNVSELEQCKALHHSKLIFFRDYLRANPFKILIASTIFKMIELKVRVITRRKLK